MKNILIIILFALMLASCEKPSNIKVPNVDPELVVAGFIAPNEDSLMLKLTWTTPIYNHPVDYDNLSENEQNADVSFIDNGNITKLNYDTMRKCYVAVNTHYSIGDEIKLSIKVKDYDELTAKCSIPKEPKYELSYKGIKVIDRGDYTERLLQFNFVCKASEPISYYRIKMMSYSTQNNYSDEYELSLYENEFLTLSPNQEVTLNANYHWNGSVDSIRYYIINCSEDYYKYHKSVENYQGDDFFVEPSIIYDNIENGIGSFSAFNMVSDTLIAN